VSFVAVCLLVAAAPAWRLRRLGSGAVAGWCAVGEMLATFRQLACGHRRLSSCGTSIILSTVLYTTRRRRCISMSSSSALGSWQAVGAVAGSILYGVVAAELRCAGSHG
jgi:hypothetical protein